MSNRVQGWVWDHAKSIDINGNELVVLLKMADIADDDGFCWPSYDHLAEKANINKSTAIRIVGKLEERGQLLVLRMPNHGAGHFNKYVVAMGRDPLAIADHFGWEVTDESRARSEEEETSQVATILVIHHGDRTAEVKGGKLPPYLSQNATLKGAQRCAQVPPKPLEPNLDKSNNNLESVDPVDNLDDEPGEVWDDAERERRNAEMRQRLRRGERVTPSSERSGPDVGTIVGEAVGQ